MVKSIKVQEVNNDTFVRNAIEFGAKDFSQVFSYRIRDVEGLTPVTPEISTDHVAGLEGSKFVSSRLPLRNIVIRFKFDPNYALGESVSSLISQLYDSVSTKVLYRLLVTTDDRSVYIKGYIESIEISRFSEDPTGTISFICPRPYFESTSTISRTIDVGKVVSLRDILGPGESGIDLLVVPENPWNSIQVYNQVDEPIEWKASVNQPKLSRFSLSTDPDDPYVKVGGALRLDELSQGGFSATLSKHRANSIFIRIGSATAEPGIPQLGEATLTIRPRFIAV